MLQAIATLAFICVAVGVVTLMARVLIQNSDAIVAALGLAKPRTAFTPLSPRYRVNSRRATFVRMEAAPLRRAA